MNLTRLSELATFTAVRKGFHPDDVVESIPECRNVHYLATRIALIHSEASEALEELRNNPLNLDAFGEELADIVIRVADLAHISGVDLEVQVEAKMAKNAGRPYQHGGRTL